jgi:hypothetical protein
LGGLFPRHLRIVRIAAEVSPMKPVYLSPMKPVRTTDELIRFAGQDPYRYAKARFLAATRELRVRLAARAHADDLRDSAAELPRRLQSIRCDDRLSLADRRAILLGLRSELEATSPEGRTAAARIDGALDDLDGPGGTASCPPR